MVYQDILAGVPITEIVSQEMAEEMIYNTVVTYVNGLQEDDLVELEVVEDEDEDPVVDSEFPKTIAVVPGAFKPPHMGHLDMVRKYSAMADEVIVLISRPTRSGRKLPNGREITAEDSLKIWETLVGGLPNVEVAISDHASPINAAYEFVGDDGPLLPNTTVVLGASQKGGDWQRWAGAEKYIKKGCKPLAPRRHRGGCLSAQQWGAIQR